MHDPTYRITHTTAFVTPVEREIAQWVHPMKDRSDDPSHHERTLYLWATSRSSINVGYVVYIYIYIYMCVCMYVLMYWCMYICMYVCIIPQGAAHGITKQICDIRMYRNAMAVCHSAKRFIFSFDVDVSVKNFCGSIAKAYYHAVDIFGHGSYRHSPESYCQSSWVQYCL